MVVFSTSNSLGIYPRQHSRGVLLVVARTCMAPVSLNSGWKAVSKRKKRTNTEEERRLCVFLQRYHGNVFSQLSSVCCCSFGFL